MRLDGVYKLVENTPLDSRQHVNLSIGWGLWLCAWKTQCTPPLILGNLSLTWCQISNVVMSME